MYEKGKQYLASDEFDDWLKAVKCFRLALDKGQAEAEYQLGLCYLEGKGVPRNRPEALRRLTAAAEGGHAEAMVRLSLLYLEGLPNFDDASHFDRLIAEDRGGKADIDVGQARDWAGRAVERGAEDGHVSLGYIHSLDDPAYHDIDLAIDHYRAATRAGSRKGGLGLGQTLLRFRGDDPAALKEAEQALLLAMDGKSPVTPFLLGGLYEVGSGVDKDLARSRDLYRQAAEGGVVKAMFRLGVLLSGGQGGPANPVEGETWLRRAAVKGEWMACRLLAQTYAAQNDAHETRQWYETGARHGDPVCAFALGGLLERLQDPDRLSLEIAEYYLQALKGEYDPAAPRLAAFAADAANTPASRALVLRELEGLCARDNPLACLALALFLRSAKDGDLARARALFIRASQAGLVTAHVAAGEMVINGLGGDADTPLALEFFSKGANAGHPGAMYAVGLLHQGQGGMTPDMAQAVFWHRRAAAAGHTLAQRILDTLGPASDGQAAQDTARPAEIQKA